MGLLQFKLPVAYTQPFAEGSEGWTRHHLWRALADDNMAIGALIVNNYYLVTVHEQGLILQSPNVEDRPWRVCPDIIREFVPKTPIGFARTRPDVKDVKVPPYRLYMDEVHRVYLGGQFRTVEDAVPCTDVKLYRQLLSTGNDAIYLSAAGPKFI